ncbi:MAG: gliding motility-associated C-terminal domain-containing protein, partial [Flavobacteriales bacterium]
VSSYEEFDNGCSTTGIANINIPGIPQPEIVSDPGNAVICPGASLVLDAQNADSYSWIGPLGEDLGDEQSITVSAPGNYVCEITIGDCVQESNVIEAQLYATPYILALPNTDLCETGMVTLIVQSFPDAIIEWQAPLSGSATYQNVFEPNVYSVQVEFCNIVTEVEVEVILSLPEATISASSDILCPGGSITLTANDGMSDYTWMPGGQHTSSIIITQPGSYSVQVETDNGCEAESETFTIDIYPINAPNVSNTSVCFGEQASLTANGQGIYWATDQFGFDVVAESNTYLTPPITESEVYFVFAEDENCSSLGNDVVISIYPSSTVSISATDSAFCAGQNLSLTSQQSAGIQYTWTLPNGNNANGITLTINNLEPADNGWYFFQGSDNNCDSSIDSIFINVENPQNDGLIAESDLGVCVNSELIVTTSQVSDDYSWTTPLGNFDESTIVVDDANYNAEGTWVLVVPGTYCATNTDTVHVNVVPYPEINLIDSTIFCDGGYMMAHVTAGYDIYIWNTGDTDNEAIVPVDGFIHVEAINLPGCSDRDSAYVENIDCIYEFPNIFTPDGNSENEYVDFGWLRIPIDEVLIFNRWGNLIRNLETAPFIWNGRTEAGELVSDGVYYYIVKSGNPGKHFRNLSGYIHVLGEKNNLRN